MRLREDNPFNFKDKDPEHFEVREVPGAGKGLFASKDFRKGEFLITYRGTIKIVSADNPYSFDTGPPEDLIVYSSDDLSCIARFINDIDPFHKKKSPQKNLQRRWRMDNCLLRYNINFCGRGIEVQLQYQRSSWQKNNLLDQK